MTGELEGHLDVAARWAIRLAFESWAEEAWESYFPDVGQYDFDRIIERAQSLLPADVPVDEWIATYNWFELRSEKSHD